MMRKTILTALILWIVGCGMNRAADITIRFKGAKAKVEQRVKDSVSVTVDGAHVSIVSQYTTHKLSVRLTGKSEDGQLILKTSGKAKVKLDGLHLTCQEGAPLWLKNKKKVEIVAVDGTENTLAIAACNDTANHKATAIFGKDKLKFSGTGTLNVQALGNGCKGIRAKDDITIEELTLNVTTTGDNLGEDTTRMMGFGGPPPNFNFDDLPEEVKAHIEEMRKQFESMMEKGEFPIGGFGGPMGGIRHAEGDSLRHGGFPPFGDRNGEGGMPPGGGKRKYIATTKGIKSLGKIFINSGNVTVKTASPGAEGIEGKMGVELNGGNVNVMAVDDAINANERIYFNGAHVVAISTTNDAVDANYGDGGMPPFFGGQGRAEKKDVEPAIIITAGTVHAWSQMGAPEEGLDCDFSPIQISGGKVFSVGAGMGDMPSVPTNETAQQATALLVGINITKDEPVYISDSKNNLIDTVTVPFTLQRSSSIVSNPSFKVGGTYSVKTRGYEKTFTLSENFTIVR